MIDFSISGIKNTIERIEYLQRDIDNLYSHIHNVYLTLKQVLDSSIMETEKYISEAKEDINQIDNAITQNSYKRSSVSIAIDKANKAYESIKSSEGASEDAVKAAYQLYKTLMDQRDIIDRMQEKLRTLRGRVQMALSTLNEQCSKLKKSEKELTMAEINFYTEYRKVDNSLKSNIASCNNALSAVNGVFTACKVDSVDVLVQYKASLKKSVDKLVKTGEELNYKLNVIKNNISNVEFVDNASKDASKMINAITDQKQGLNNNIKLLDKYINALRAYVRA